MKPIAVIILLNFTVFAGYMVYQGIDGKKAAGIFTFGLLASALLFMGDRLTKVKGGGFELAAEAVADAEEIKKIRKEMESQRDAMSLVFSDSKNLRTEIGQTQNELKTSREKLAEVSGMVDKATIQLSTITEIQKDASKSLVELKSFSNFSDLVIRADNDDREALSELLRIANKTGKFQKIALNAVIKISNDSLMAMYDDASVQKIFADRNLPVSTSCTYEEYVLAAQKVPPALQAPYLYLFFKQERFGKPRLLKMAADTIRSTKSIKALYLGVQAMEVEAKLNQNILGAENFLKWWDTHQGEYVDENPPVKIINLDKKNTNPPMLVK